jgi:hypothetical protein
MKFTGGVNYPTPMGRGNATWPLGALTLDEGGIELRMGFGRFGFTVLPRTDRFEVEGIFPCRGGLLASPGVGLRLGDGREFYFWTSRESSREIIGLLEQEGFPASHETRRTLVYKARR